MNFDVEEFRKKIINAKESKDEYEMQTVDPPARFKLKPRTVARVERVLAILDEDRERRSKMLEAVSKGELPPPEELPEPEYIIKWRVFREITEGDHDRIEIDLKEYLDLSVVDSAIYDFFVTLT